MTTNTTEQTKNPKRFILWSVLIGVPAFAAVVCFDLGFNGVGEYNSMFLQLSAFLAVASGAFAGIYAKRYKRTGKLSSR